MVINLHTSSSKRNRGNYQRPARTLQNFTSCTSLSKCYYKISALHVIKDEVIQVKLKSDGKNLLKISFIIIHYWAAMSPLLEAINLYPSWTYFIACRIKKSLVSCQLTKIHTQNADTVTKYTFGVILTENYQLSLT